MVEEVRSLKRRGPVMRRNQKKKSTEEAKERSLRQSEAHAILARKERKRGGCRCPTEGVNKSPGGLGSRFAFVGPGLAGV